MNALNGITASVAAGLGYSASAPAAAQISGPIPALGAAWTIEGWIETSVATHSHTLYAVATSVPANPLHLFIDANGSLAVAVVRTDVAIHDTVTVRDGLPHYATVTYDGTTLRLYRDGVLAGSMAATISLTGTTGYIGNAVVLGVTSTPATVTMDELAVYSVALTATRVQAHFHAGQGALESYTVLSTRQNASSALLTAGAGIAVRRNGVVIMSGPVTHREDIGDEHGDRSVVSGLDDNVWLADRLAVPCLPPYTTQEADLRTGPAETVMYGYVGANAVTSGAWVTVSRPAVTGLSMAIDLARGSTVNGRARFVSLLDLLTDLALTGGDLGFRVVQQLTSPPTLQFQVYVPVDRTGTAVFSRDLGNLRSYQYTNEAPTANAITVGGQGEGVARTFASGTDAASIASYGRRIEYFHDRRDASTTAELTQTITDDLAQRAERAVLTLQPIDSATLSYLNTEPTRSYGLGDKVTVMVNDVPIQQVVREVHITLTPEGGEIVEPIIGTPGAILPHTATYVLRHLHRRLSLVERR